jgi:hypothetical protein
VTVQLNNGGTTQTSYNPGPGTNPFSKTDLNGPFNYIAAVSVFKVFPIKENVNLRFNMDVFNVLNDQGYLNPNGTDGTESLQSAYWNNASGNGTGPRNAIHAPALLLGTFQVVEIVNASDIKARRAGIQKD